MPSPCSCPTPFRSGTASTLFFFLLLLLSTLVLSGVSATLTCEYTLVLQSDKGGRMLTVAPSNTYDPRFTAAVQADLEAAIFHRTTTHVSRGAFFDSFFSTSTAAGGGLSCAPPLAPLSASAAAVVGNASALNTVSVLAIQKKFYSRLRLIAVHFAVTTDLFSSGSVSSRVAREAGGGGEAAAREEEALPERGAAEDAADAQAPAASRALSYYFFLASTVFDEHVVDDFFYSLIRRRSGCSLSSRVTPFFPSLTIDEVYAIAKNHSLPPRGPPGDATATAARNGYIRYLCRENSGGEACTGVTCAMGVLCFALIASSMVGALVPVFFGACIRRSRDRKDEARLNLHHQ